MDYPSAEKYLLSLFDAEKSRRPVRYNERKFAHVKTLFEALGNPQDCVRSFHIAGTKGKGSTAVFLSAGLAALGFRVGTYTSPHLFSLRERITTRELRDGRVVEKPISKREVARYLTRLIPAARALQRQRTAITFFEALTALAFLFFKGKRVDYAVVETGLGGRFDATNIIQPLCTILTAVGYDHTAQLGTRLKDIAYQKAGIIKEGVPVISAPQRASVLNVFAQEARRKHAALEVLGKNARVAVTACGPARVRFNFYAPFVQVRGLSLPAYNVHQAYNSALALLALYRTIPAQRIVPQLLKEAFSRAVLPGRFQIVSLPLSKYPAIGGENSGAGRRPTDARRGTPCFTRGAPADPLVIVDVAHNPVSIKVLCGTLQRHFPRKPFIIVFGTSCDKDIRGMARWIRTLKPKQVIATKAHTPRGMDPLRIKEACAGENCRVYPESSDAFLNALSLYEKGDCLVVCGSFFLVAEALRFFSTQMGTDAERQMITDRRR